MKRTFLCSSVCIGPTDTNGVYGPWVASGDQAAILLTPLTPSMLSITCLVALLSMEVGVGEGVGEDNSDWIEESLKCSTSMCI